MPYLTSFYWVPGYAVDDDWQATAEVQGGWVDVTYGSLYVVSFYWEDGYVDEDWRQPGATSGTWTLI